MASDRWPYFRETIKSSGDCGKHVPSKEGSGYSALPSPLLLRITDNYTSPCTEEPEA